MPTANCRPHYLGLNVLNMLMRDEFDSVGIMHYSDVIMVPMASQITSLTIINPIVYSGADQRKHQSSASLAFVREIHRWQVNFPQKWPVTRKMFPFDDVTMASRLTHWSLNEMVGIPANSISIFLKMVTFWLNMLYVYENWQFVCIGLW